MLAGTEKKLKVFCSKKEAALIHVGTFQSSLINTIHTILYIVYYVSIIPDRYGSVRIFIPDRPSVFIRPDIFRYDFHNRERFERSDFQGDTRCIG